jgi:hypothetical protein
MTQRRVVEDKLRRTLGFDPQHRDFLAAENKKYADWRAKCQRCAHEWMGTLDQLRVCPRCEHGKEGS